MTEEEAKKTRCCGPQGCGEWSSYSNNDGESVFGYVGEPIRFCIGTACMGWRWRTIKNPDWKEPNHMAFPPHDRSNEYIKSKDDGFCGLAGQL
jgi:hypothetical protein